MAADTNRKTGMSALQRRSLRAVLLYVEPLIKHVYYFTFLASRLSFKAVFHELFREAWSNLLLFVRFKPVGIENFRVVAISVPSDNLLCIASVLPSADNTRTDVYMCRPLSQSCLSCLKVSTVPGNKRQYGASSMSTNPLCPIFPYRRSVVESREKLMQRPRVCCHSQLAGQPGLVHGLHRPQSAQPPQALVCTASTGLNLHSLHMFQSAHPPHASIYTASTCLNLHILLTFQSAHPPHASIYTASIYLSVKSLHTPHHSTSTVASLLHSISTSPPHTVCDTYHTQVFGKVHLQLMDNGYLDFYQLHINLPDH